MATNAAHAWIDILLVSDRTKNALKAVAAVAVTESVLSLQRSELARRVALVTDEELADFRDLSAALRRNSHLLESS